MMTKIFLLFALFCSSVHADTLMTSPKHGERVEVSDHTVTLKWNEFPGATSYFLDIFPEKKASSIKTIQVNGTSYVLKFKKLPPTFYWRVRALEDLSPTKKLNTVYLYEKPILNISLYAEQLSSHVSVKSTDVNNSANVTGPMVEAHVDYSPVRWKNKYSFAAHVRTSDLKNGSGDALKEQRLGAEFGYHFNSGLSGKNILYAGYHIVNNLKFKFDDTITANYKVNFLTLRYFYQRPVFKTWEMELGTGVQFPFPYTWKPSFIFRPLLGKRIGTHWRLDGFL
ncbi:MAG: hypothetical protein ACJ76H_14310, partial [Bacteriovoracaceae bacterium]